MGKLNKYKHLVGLSRNEKILRQIELSDDFGSKKQFSKFDKSKPKIHSSGSKKSKDSRLSDDRARRKRKKSTSSNIDGDVVIENSTRKWKRKKILHDDKDEILDVSDSKNEENESKIREKCQIKKTKISNSKISNSKISNSPNLNSSNLNSPNLNSSNLNSSISNSPILNSKPTKNVILKNDLKSRMEERLKSGQFRYINEIFYTTTGVEAKEIFAKDPRLFNAYHDGYRNQKRKWPFDPLDDLIRRFRRISSKYIVADMGCGDARLASSIKQKVHSFDLVSLNDRVVAADIANVPLADTSVDVCVFCLSLMGTNLDEYIREANRILKDGGFMKIVEIRSRFDSIGRFRRAVERLGFQLAKNVTLPDDYFIEMDFQKVASSTKNTRVDLSLKPCVYKKR